LSGRTLVRIDLNEDVSKYRLPLGAVAQVAVYSDHWRPVAAIRRNPAANEELDELRHLMLRAIGEALPPSL